MNILELYAGSRSIGKVGDLRGHNVFSVDVKPFDGINLVKDCEFITMEDIPFIPDMVWSGTPCTTYSLAAISHHRNPDYSAKSDFAHKCDRMNTNNMELIKQLLEVNPEMIWYIENPRGVLKYMPYMKGLPNTMITYCSYGDIANKPTVIFSNNIRSLFNPNGWNPKPMCPRYKYNEAGEILNKHCHHEGAQRGSKTGTQGKKGNYERSKYPVELCDEIIKATEIKLGINEEMQTL